MTSFSHCNRRKRLPCLHFILLFSALLLPALLLPAIGLAQSPSTNPPNRGRATQGPRVISPEVSGDRKITFRILAPKAETVKLSAGDIPNLGQGSALTKGSNGVWEVTVGPVPFGAFRYNFNV